MILNNNQCYIQVRIILSNELIWVIKNFKLIIREKSHKASEAKVARLMIFLCINNLEMHIKTFLCIKVYREIEINGILKSNHEQPGLIELM